ncbi:hypothetical protein BV22DRAFT_1048426, partial [Leucogyrophana mollusca]
VGRGVDEVGFFLSRSNHHALGVYDALQVRKSSDAMLCKECSNEITEVQRWHSPQYKQLCRCKCKMVHDGILYHDDVMISTATSHPSPMTRDILLLASDYRTRRRPSTEDAVPNTFELRHVAIVCVQPEAVQVYIGLSRDHTTQQCTRKFFELPIEDPYIAAGGEAGVVGTGVVAKTALHELTDGGGQAEETAGDEGEEKAEDKDGEEKMTEDPVDVSGETDPSVPTNDDTSADPAANPTPAPKPQTPPTAHQRAVLARKSSLCTTATVAHAEGAYIWSAGNAL